MWSLIERFLVLFFRTHLFQSAFLHHEYLFGEVVVVLGDVLEKVFEAIHPLLLSHLITYSFPELRLEILQVLGVHLNLHQHLVQNPETALEV